MVRKSIAGLAAIVVILVVAGRVRALLETSTTGDWPADWPRELEPLRAHARSTHVANGTQETIFEITFADRSSFEAAWPAILSLKTPGAPLRLFRVDTRPVKDPKEFTTPTVPTVKIFAPADAFAPMPDHQRAGPTVWPKEIVGPKGELPEFVERETVGGKETWVVAPPAASDKDIDFRFRARIDLELIADDKIIDLNRIQLPASEIVDRRF
jgi:hypothetical protein